MKKCYDKNDFIYAGSCISFDLFEAIEKCFVPVMKGLLRVHGSFSHRFIFLSAKGRRSFAGPLSVPCGRQVAAATTYRWGKSRWRAVPAARSRCDAMDNSVASVAAVLLTKPSARHPAPEGAATCSPLGGGYPRGRGGHGATGAYSQKGCVGRKSLVIKEGHVAASRRPLGSLLHPFLERKGCVRPGMRGCHHLPVEDVALAGSARSQVALWRRP